MPDAKAKLGDRIRFQITSRQFVALAEGWGRVVTIYPGDEDDDEAMYKVIREGDGREMMVCDEEVLEVDVDHSLVVLDEFSEMTAEQVEALLAWEPPSSAKFVLFQTKLPS